VSAVLFTNARVVTPEGPGPHRGTSMRNLRILDNADVLIDNARIAAIEPAGTINPPRDAHVIDARSRVLMPSFVDAHTHACWAGDRVDEWTRKLAGATYLDLLKAGGGIMSTVRAVRASTQQELAANLAARLGLMLRAGTTTVEVKSGYGLSTTDELKMLRAVRDASRSFPGAVVPTALIAHAIDADHPSRADFIETTIHETLDAIHTEFPGITLDAYCEDGAWSLDECARLFSRAQTLAHPFRAHADQFNSLGMTRWAIDHGAQSVDHLEATSPDDLASLARSSTYGVMLPCAGFHTDGRYANGRAFIDAGGQLVIATNCNPGSAPTHSMPMAIALAVRFNRITPSEAITATTANAAALLGFTDRAHISIGARADLILLRHTDERALAFEFGDNPVDVVVSGGAIIAPA
jgi:imidazolonepropionase